MTLDAITDSFHRVVDFLNWDQLFGLLRLWVIQMWKYTFLSDHLRSLGPLESVSGNLRKEV